MYIRKVEIDPFDPTEGTDTAIIVGDDELENLKYILREYARNEVSRGMVEQVSFWLSLLTDDELDSAMYEADKTGA